jgi:hypothetical protein
MMSLVQLLLERGRFDSLKYFWLWLAVDFRFQNTSVRTVNPQHHADVIHAGGLLQGLWQGISWCQSSPCSHAGTVSCKLFSGVLWTNAERRTRQTKWTRAAISCNK